MPSGFSPMSFKMSVLAYRGNANQNIDSRAKGIIAKTLGAAMNYGIDSQKKGKYHEALEIYKLAVPFLKGAKKEAVESEIKKLEKQK